VTLLYPVDDGLEGDAAGLPGKWSGFHGYLFFSFTIISIITEFTDLSN
jgi:hypothetical protein